MPGRTYENPEYSGTNSYRYAFNGKEHDSDGEFGSLTHYDYGFRIYNPAIAKFLSVDPLTASYPWYTPYQFAGNKPIWAIDLDGLEEHFTTSSGKDGYHKFCGGTVINVKDDRWLYYNAGRGIFGGGYARIYDVEKYGGWSPAIEFNKHLQTGTGHGLSVGEYSRSTYTDPITSAFAMMFFATTGSAILLPSMGSAGTASMSSVSTTVGSLFTKGSGISFAADALSQTTFNVIEGKDPVENYNFVSGVSNTFLHICPK